MKTQNLIIVKFIYLDNESNTCYDKVINKSPREIIIEQKLLIAKQLKSLDSKYTNTVIFIGHKPLITFRFKTNKMGKAKNPKILSLLICMHILIFIIFVQIFIILKKRT